MRTTNLLRSQAEKIGFKRAKSGAPPGTMVYTGRKEMDQTHVHLTQYGPAQDRFEHQMAEDAIPDVHETFGTTWYDVRGLHDVELIETLGKRYDIHPLALEDIVDVLARPKMEAYKDGVLFQLKAFAFDEEKRQLSVEQVSIYLYENTVLTFQEDAGDLFASVRKRLETKSGRIRSRSADYLAYALVDNVTDRYFNVLDKIEETLDALEDGILKRPEVKTKGKIHDLKLSLLTMRKSISPLREMVGSFGDSDHKLITEDTQLFVRDLKDHVIQVNDLIETYRDVTNGLYDLYVSEISFRTNSVVQTLTIVSTIFMPLSFLAGIYGMNFEYIPELHARRGYFILLGVMVTIVVVMLFWFRRRGWLQSGDA
ncbi:magnesium/cobalt transporter CorA [Neolewinella antarctica]|uniref:Magnesium transport protein CorA n=1 Tax=Neolewinella antarctica TaxID=442734 RepID=A0ABX0XD85_9BACT|nr:magnesium/cobalt transporter CorA [Neolewinella antarctica]NJC27263.1 magnesium transporter [Neolewinella antarctica]